jgi:hypothetical protein
MTTKSKIIVIIRSLVNSPLGCIILNIIKVSIVMLIFYQILCFNVYLINNNILIKQTNDSGNIWVGAMAYLYFEIIFIGGLIGIIYIIILLCYDAIVGCIKAYKETKNKLDNDINTYHLNMVTWQK